MTSRCPKRHDLRQFLLGELPGGEADSLSQHLLACPDCLATVANLEAEDTLVAALRALVPSNESEKALLDDLMHRVGELQPSSEGRGQTADAALTPPFVPLTRSWARYETRVAGEVGTCPDEAGPEQGGTTNLPHTPGYELLTELGRGGMGVVYKARQLRLDRLVALKMIRLGSAAGPQELARFRTEAETLARLQHPNIVQIYEIGEHAGQPYLALEFVAGRSLDRVLAGTPQEPRAAAGLVETLARAVQAAHQCGVIHRDLKPANVLLQKESGARSQESEGRKERDGIPSDSWLVTPDSCPKITDFGLAKRLGQESGHTETGQVMGTPSYMAPEQAQARREAIGPATDVYALGAILYEMLTGRPPFKAATTLDTLMQVILQEPVPLSRLQPKVPRDLETICLKCLHKDRHRRYPSAAELAEDLRRFHAGEPIRGRPTPCWERAVKWARRRPTAAVLALVAAAVPFLLLGFLLWHSQDLQAQLTQALADRSLQTTRAEGQALLRKGQTALTARDFHGAQLHFAAAVEKTGSEPALGELKADAERLLAEAQKQLDELAGRQAAQGKRHRFLQGRDEALFYESQFTGLDLPTSLEATRRTAREALALFGILGDDPAAPALSDAHFSPEEKTEIITGCYELLLILAEATAKPLAGEDRRRQADEALHLLNQAARLRPLTKALHLRRAGYLEQVGDDGGAAEAQAQAERLPPADAVDHFLLGDACYQRKDLPAAIAHFREALRLQPDHFWAQYLMAVCHLRTQRPAQAEVGLTACEGLLHSQRRAFIWIYILRGFAHGELGVRARDEGRTADATAHFAAAEADFRRAEALKPNDDARYVLAVNRGVTRLQQKHHDEAITDLQSAIRARPGQFNAHWSLAQAYQDQRKYGEALTALDEAVRLRPDLGALYHARGRLHLDRRDLPAARRDFEEAIRRSDPGRLTAAETRLLVDAYTEVGKLLYHEQQYDAALQAFTAALRLQPDYAPAQRWTGGVLLELKRYAEAVRAFDGYFRSGPPAAEVYEARGLARARLADYAGAVADYSRALELEPSAAVHAHRGWTYLVGGAAKLALDDFEAAVRLDPASGDAWVGRGYALVQLGRYEAGTADIREAVRRGPPTPRLLWNAARGFALAVVQVDAAPPPRSRSLLTARSEYQDRAVQLLRQGLELVPAAERATFWRDHIQTNGDLDSIRRSPGFAQLAAEFAGPAR